MRACICVCVCVCVCVRVCIISIYLYPISSITQANANVVVQNNIDLGLRNYPSYICFSITMFLLCTFLNPLALACAIPAVICSCVVSCIVQVYIRHNLIARLSRVKTTLSFYTGKPMWAQTKVEGTRKNWV